MQEENDDMEEKKTIQTTMSALINDVRKRL